MKNFIDKKIKEFEKQDKKFQIGFELNQQAMKYEQQGKKELAIEYYEKAVSAQFNGSHPYQQLTKIYLQQKRYDDVVRIISAYKDVLPKGYFETSTEGKIIWFRNQLENAKKATLPVQQIPTGCRKVR